MVELKDKLQGKVLVLGIGNTLKEDDGAGPHCVRKSKIQNPKSKINLLDGGLAPENYTGKIKEIKPDTLVIIDAVDFREKPGSLKIIEEKEIGIYSFSTHNISIKTFIGFLKVDLPDLKTIIIGVQPKKVGFGEGLSPEVLKAVDELCMSLV